MEKVAVFSNCETGKTGIPVTIVPLLLQLMKESLFFLVFPMQLMCGESIYVRWTGND